MDKARYLAVIEFRHGSDCTLGQPYGGCGSGCGPKVVKQISQHPLTREELLGYGVAPVEERRLY